MKLLTNKYLNKVKILKFNILTLTLVSITMLLHANPANPLFKFNTLTNRDGLTHNTVNEIAQDSSGTIWIATKEGLNKYNSYEIINYYTSTNPEIPSNIIQTIYVSSENTVYAGTNAGLIRYNEEFDNFTNLKFNGINIPSVFALNEDKEGNIFIGTIAGLYKYFPATSLMVKFSVFNNTNIQAIAKYNESFFILSPGNLSLIDQNGTILKTFNNNNSTGLKTSVFSCVFQDSRGNILVGTEDNGLFKLNIESNEFKNIAFTSSNLSGSNFVRAINEDQKGNIWIGTESGLFIYNPEKEKSAHIYHSLEYSEYNLNDNAVYCIFESRENMMWIGTYFGGINYTNLDEQNRFLHIYAGIEKDELPGKAINKIFQSSDNNLWIATEDGGVCKMHPVTKEILQIFQYDPLKNSISSNNIHSITEDKFGNIWFGHFTKGIDIYNPSTGNFRNVLPNPDLKDEIFGNSIYSLFTDSRNNVWVGSRRNVKTYDFEEDEFIDFKPDIINNFIYHILEARNGNIWICTRNSGVYKYEPIKDSLSHYGPSNPAGLSSLHMIAATEDKQGRIWFGTMGGGVAIYIPEKDSFETVAEQDGLINNTVYGILEEKNEIMWFSTNKGLSRYNYKTKEIRNYSLEDGLSQKQFNFSSYFKNNRGIMFFGTIDGLTYFDPDKMGTNPVKPYVMFTNLRLFNNPVNVNESKILSKHINNTREISLNYAQNVITIDFVAVNHSSSGSNKFQYYLEGFDKDWNKTREKTSVTYTNLSPGDYTFHLKAMNNDGLESSNVKTLQIHVARPWWLTNLAIFLYVSLIVTIILYFRRRGIIREKEKALLKLEKMEKQKMKELNQQRLNFFTYISHEFKTPLSIILASIEEAFENHQFSEEVNKHIQRLKRSANRLSFLITQLMDFRKIETRHAKLILHKGDLVRFIYDTCLVFSPILEKKNIQFHFNSNKDESINWFDPDKIEKIVTNLLSNAIKFTTERGIIRCEIIIEPRGRSKSSESLQVKVSDTGS